MELSGRRAAVLVENLYQELELWYPVYRLREAGATVHLVGPEAGQTYTSKHGYPARSDLAAGAVTAADFDAVVVPGGYAPDYLRRHPAVVHFVREMYGAGKLVAAICHAGWVLASAGIVRGRRLTSYASIRDDLTNAGATWVDEPVVVDGNLITARFPDDLPVFLREIVARLAAAVPAAAGSGPGR